MTDHPQNTPPQAPVPDDAAVPTAKATPKRRLPSLIWLIPIVAALAGGWIAVHAIMQRGPTITITFETAEGIEAGKTKIKYKDVDIGSVTGVVLTDDRQHIKVTAQLAHATDDLLGEKTRFWVVRPRISGGSVSGLGTLLSGAYISIDPTRQQSSKRDFTGLEQAPIVTARQAGREFVLRAQDLGSIDVGAPLFFRRVQVGEVSAYSMDKDGKGVTVKAFVHAPYDQYVTTNTRFWHASGFDVTLDASGLRVETQSLASIAIGGIAFQAPPDQEVAEAAPADTSFTLAADRASAMKEADRERAPFVLYFRESLRGLSIGAPVDFRGITIGEVKAINFEFSKEQHSLLMPVTIDLYPERLRGRLRGSDEAVKSDEMRIKILNAMVEHGLRAQLRTGNLITGQLYVALDFVPSATKATIDWKEFPPSLPTINGSLTQLQDTALSIAKKLDSLPIEAMGDHADEALRNLNTVLDNSNALINRLKNEVAPEAQNTLKQAQDAINQAKQTLSPDAPVQQNLNDTLQEVAKAAQAFRDLSDYLSRHPDSLIRGQKEDAK